MANLHELARSAQKIAAGSTSMYLAMRSLPKKQRFAIFELYAFGYKVDYIADGDTLRTERLAQLGKWEADINAIYEHSVPDGLENLANAIFTFGLYKKDLIDIIDGVRTDVIADTVAPDEATLDSYCDRVSSSFGRSCVKIFGMPADDGELVAYHLGRALQLVDILADIDEDGAIGRVYLPRKALIAANIDINDIPSLLRSTALQTVCESVAVRVDYHFKETKKVLDPHPRHIVRASRIFCAIHTAKLRKLRRAGWLPPRPRIGLSSLHKVWLAFSAVMHF